LIKEDVLDRLGLTPEKVAALVAKNTMLRPDEVIAITSKRKGCYGRGGLPENIVNAMIAEYRSTNSLAKTAAKFNRSRQSLWQILHSRILLNPLYSIRHEPVIYQGEKFTPEKDGYLRRSAHKAGRETFLQRLVWIEHRGPIPPGHQVMFRDGDRRNCAIKNLYCVSRVEAATGRPSGNAWTKFYAGLGPRPVLTPVSSEKRSESIARVWAHYTPRQKKNRLRGIHRRWNERHLAGAAA
jgi:hypothetical protein